MNLQQLRFQLNPFFKIVMLIFKKKQMKTINNYKYILMLAVVALFASCSEDDDVAVAPASTNIQMIVEAFVNSQIEITGHAGTNNANIELGFRLTEHSTSYRGSDVNITYDGNEYVIPAGEDEVIVGVTNVEFELDAPGGGEIPFNGITMTSIIDFTANFEVVIDNRPSDLVVIKKGSITVSATVYNQLPQSNPNGIELLLDWENPGANDVDLYFSLGDVNGDYLGWYLRSWTVSRYENLTLPLDDSFDDSSMLGTDQYFVEINTQWVSGQAAVDYKLFVAYPDGSLEIFDGTTTGGEVNNMDIKVVKTTDMDDVVEYTFETVD